MSKLREIRYGSASLRLHCNMGVGIGGDKWPAAELFCELVTDPQWKTYFEGLFEGKTVIELGAGTGFVGILLEKLFRPSGIAISDQGSHIDLITRNIAENAAVKCSAVELDWFKLPKKPQKYDIVLAFECVYNETLYEPFIDALLSTADNNSLIFMGLTRSFCKPHFFSLLSAKGVSYTLLPQEALPLEYRNEASGRDVGMFICRINKEL